MPSTSTPHAIATLAVLVQLGIFIYLYRADVHRVPFFLYLIWAWGCFALFNGAKFVHALSLEFSASLFLMRIAGSSSALLVLAAGLAYRRNYRLRWQHVSVGLVLVLSAVLWETLAVDGRAAWPWRACVGGGLFVIGGLLFWPQRATPTPYLGRKFLALALTLWGLHLMAMPFLAASTETQRPSLANVSLVFLYFLIVFATIILVMDRARAVTASLKEFNERLVDGLGEGLALIDATFTLRHVNQWLTQQFGPVLGQRCYQVLTAEGRQCPGCPMAERAQMHSPVRLSITGPEERHLQLTCSPVRQPDGQVFLLELVADVTEQERLRARLSDAEHLAAAGELAAGVAHEIRNPLSAIVNAATLLEQEAVLTPEERRTTLEAVKQEARRLNKTLADFLTFARPPEPERVPGDIGAVVERVATLLREAHGQEGGVEVVVQLDATVPRFAFDADQLTQVLWNIALNGVQAMAGKGRLTLAVARQAEAVWLTVADTGPGIPLAQQRRIFQPFVSTRQGGTGLGLALARRIVTAHAGHIEVESAPGQGSRFIVRLPLQEA